MSNQEFSNTINYNPPFQPKDVARSIRLSAEGDEQSLVEILPHFTQIFGKVDDPELPLFCTTILQQLDDDYLAMISGIPQREIADFNLSKKGALLFEVIKPYAHLAWKQLGREVRADLNGITSDLLTGVEEQDKESMSLHFDGNTRNYEIRHLKDMLLPGRSPTEHLQNFITSRKRLLDIMLDQKSREWKIEGNTTQRELNRILTSYIGMRKNIGNLYEGSTVSSVARMGTGTAHKAAISSLGEILADETNLMGDDIRGHNFLQTLIHTLENGTRLKQSLINQIDFTAIEKTIMDNGSYFYYLIPDQAVLEPELMISGYDCPFRGNLVNWFYEEIRRFWEFIHSDEYANWYL